MNGIYFGKETILKAMYLLGLFLAIFPSIMTTIPGFYRMILPFWVPYIWLCLFLFVYKKLYKDKAVLVWVLFLVYINIVTRVNSGSFEGNAALSNFLAAAVLGGYMCKHDKDYFLRSITYYYTVVMALNTLLWRPGGTFTNSYGQMSFVIGTKTMITYYQLIAFLFAYVFFKTEKNKVKGSVVLGINLLSVLIYDILQRISTSIVCLALFVIMVLLDTFLPKISRMVLVSAFWILNILDVAIVVFRIQYIFEYFLVDVLHEDLTFDNRTYLWDEVLEHISNNPIWGYGHRSQITFLNGVNRSTHNQLLGWAFYLGIVGLLIMFGFAVWLMTKYSIHDVRGRIARMTYILCAAMWISEYWMAYPIYILMTILIANLDRYEMSDNENVLARYFYVGGKNGQ